MATETRAVKPQEQPSEVKRTNKALLRFFSVESDTNMADAINSPAPPPEIIYNFYNKEFFMKIAELVIGIICAGLYSEAVFLMRDSITSMTFPNVVFGSLIIITAVIVMSFMLGRVMPDILIRTFNAIGMVLYFVSATVTLVAWCKKSIPEHQSDLVMTKQLLLIQSVLSYINAVLYGIDMVLSVKKAVMFEI